VIRHFESRLADLIGSRIDPPFQGRVFVAPGSAGGNDPVVTVGVVAARPLEVDFGSRRPEIAPGADDPRRIVRLECDVAVTVAPGAGQGRAQTIAGLDGLLYLLDDPALRRPETLASPADDPGFVLDSLRIGAVLLAPDNGTPRLELVARGWFWPPDAPGVTGEPITAAHIRSTRLPVSLAPWPLRLRTGAGAVTLTLDASGVGTMRVDGEAVGREAFGTLAVQVLDDGGRPGAGTLSGGAAGPAGARIVTLEDGRTTVSYTPPDDPALDRLVVSIARPDGGEGPAIGIELARFPLQVDS
jgi:hypothetical protein